MTPTICGHERELLLVQLRCMTAKPGDFLAASAKQWEFLDHGNYVQRETAARAVKAVGDALSDPAKLAELLAEADHVHEYVISGNTIERCAWGRGKRLVTLNIWTMAEARVELLRILELPQDATAEDAVKALRHAD